MPPPIPPEELAAIQADVYAGRKIDAIKRMRAAAGVDLKAAKDLVEELEAKMRAATPEKFTAPPGRGGCVGLLLIGAGLSGVALWLV